MAGAAALALRNFATLALAGRPWGITSAFALWGAKGAQLLGLAPEGWAYWQVPANAQALSSSVFADVTSVMDFGIVAGAMLTAALAGRFAPSLRIPLRSLLAAVVGGLLLGYGARIAYGCNIGAYFSGIASGSRLPSPETSRASACAPSSSASAARRPRAATGTEGAGTDGAGTDAARPPRKTGSRLRPNCL